MRDETPAKLAEDHRVLLLNELNHRLKNTLVTVQSIVDHTLRSHKVPPEARGAVTDRLIALSNAHNVLVEQNWAGADLHVIVERAIAPYRRTEARRFKVDGPPLRLSPQQAVGLSLALHELCTNALKHGALTTDAGVVDISWNIAQDSNGARQMTLLWRESGGPPVSPPSRQGFGTRLIARSFGLDSGGQARLHYVPEGLYCVIEVTLTEPDGTAVLPVPGDPAARA
jgi:two-component sensor histidine kinase